MAGTPHQVVVLQHPLVEHHLGRLRDVTTRSAEFRQHVRVLASLLATEATRELPTRATMVTTPLEDTGCRQLCGRIAIVPILRAGLGMVEPLTEMIPDCEVWHLGLYRDERTAAPVSYYDKLPRRDPADMAIVLDPMLATGGSASVAVRTLMEWGVPKIILLSVISAPEGIRQLTEQFPTLQICTCAVDRGLNERRFIVPGLGDAGDRIFHT